MRRESRQPVHQSLANAWTNVTIKGFKFHAMNIEFCVNRCAGLLCSPFCFVFSIPPVLLRRLVHSLSSRSRFVSISSLFLLFTSSLVLIQHHISDEFITFFMHGGGCCVVFIRNIFCSRFCFMYVNKTDEGKDGVNLLWISLVEALYSPMPT